MLRRAWNALAGKTAHWSRFKLGLTIFLLTGIGTLVLIAGSAAGVMWSSTEKFCISCHEMRDTVYAEFKDTIHDKNRTGVRADCSACHIPHDNLVSMLWVKGTSGAKDIYHHLVTGKIDTKEKFEKERHSLAVMVWTRMKKSDSAECRHCHDAQGMDPEKQSEAARANHAKMKSEKATCIDCHFGIAHNEPEGPGPKELKIAK